MVSIFLPCRTSRSASEWKSRDSPTETRLTDRYRSTFSLSFVAPANFPRAVTVRRMANDVMYTMYAALPIYLPTELLCSTGIIAQTIQSEIKLSPLSKPELYLACQGHRVFQMEHTHCNLVLHTHNSRATFRQCRYSTQCPPSLLAHCIHSNAAVECNRLNRLFNPKLTFNQTG